MTDKNSRNVIIAAVVIVAAIVACCVYRTTAIRSTVNSGLVAGPLQFPTVKVEAPRGGVGCYYQKPGDAAWQRVECVPASEASKLHRPQADPTLITDLNGTPVQATSSASSLQEGYTGAWFYTYSGETSAFFKGTFFSIQANTNFFTGNNGDTDWAQFVYSYSPPGAFEPPMLCQWSEDVTKQFSPAPACVNTPETIVTPNFGANVYGMVSSHLKCGIRLRWGFGCTSVFNLTALLQTDLGSWSVTAPDYYGLSSSWDQIGGTILGVSQGDTAVFTSPTKIISVTGAYAPWLTTATFVNGGATTAEKNNLSVQSQYSFCDKPHNWCYLSSTIGN